ncbi:MAG: hypothetical protein ACTHJW_20055 [Streptosporangiaceae bacterium]
MRTALRNSPTWQPSDPDALIKEARRRQRIRYLLTTGALVALCGIGTGLYATLGSNPQRPRPSAGRTRPSPAASLEPTVPRLPPIGANVMMWPLGYPLGVGNYAGPPFVMDDLRASHYLQTGKINLCCGDEQPLMIVVGRWLVYAGNGATAIRSDLSGRPRVLGRTAWFAPSATPGDVWLVYPAGRASRIRQVRVDGGPPGPAITLPARTQLVAGTRAGLLLQNRNGRLRLWLPGHAMRALPGNPAWADGFGVTARLIAYGSRCHDAATTSHAAVHPGSGYRECALLRVLNVRSGRVVSVRSPAGTTGWVPPEFGREDPLAGPMIAAEAATPSRDHDTGRLYTVRLTARRHLKNAVPDSDGNLFSMVAWSPDGAWLFYQGPDVKLWGYQPRTGAIRSSTVPCCRYTVMVAVRTPAGRAHR